MTYFDGILATIQAARQELARADLARRDEIRLIIELDPEGWMHLRRSPDIFSYQIGRDEIDLAGAIVRPKPHDPIKSPVPFDVGDLVRTVKGAKFKGRVLSIYHLPPPADPRYSEAWRADVWAEAPDFAGTLHVYPVTQLVGVGR